MTDDTMPLLFTQSPRAPWREILRYRWSAQHDRALVLEDVEGTYQVLWAGAPRQERGPNTGIPTDAVEAGPGSSRLRHAYQAAFHVDIAYHRNDRALRIPHQYGPPEPVSLRVSWWVHDPAQVVGTQTTHGWNAVRRDLDLRLRDLEKTYAVDSQAVKADELTHHLGAVRRMDHCGISYEVTGTSSREADDELLLSGPDAGSFPYTWTATRREEYDFCLQAVRNGPVSLAALWLLRQPDQVRAVLDWSVSNRNLIREEVGWEDQVVGLLSCLSVEERQELSELLRDRLLALGRRVPYDQDAVQWPR
ncbi:hypothetical protein JW613_05535 [Streptomyces smyrnaeus]|uniref:PE-PGRS family protein n=1 Tax=Streptomyces smyrnaeus TaxID=1387713 RepID=A0ABS3XQS2_9ACTN|nr:hypothetical protein [Streptomyces smyrnaeus]MBO8197764.1 hypothetical protein [Streptomyces smyrnaeus]